MDIVTDGIKKVTDEQAQIDKINAQMKNMPIIRDAMDDKEESLFFRAWRPLMMYPIAFMLACFGVWNYLAYPVLTFIQTRTIVVLELDLKFLLGIGTLAGVYGAARTVEKIFKTKGDTEVRKFDIETTKSRIFK